MRTFSWLLPSVLLFCNPEAVYLTLPEDPAHAIYVHWIEKKGSVNNLFFCGDVCEHIQVALPQTEYRSCWAVLNKLEPKRSYQFFIGDQRYHFSTQAEDLASGLKVIIGGDIDFDLSSFERMQKIISEESPDILVLGGDIGYCYGTSLFGFEYPERMVEFLKKGFFKSSGELIPFMTVVGNHDVRTKRAELYSSCFLGHQKLSYRCVDIGSSLSFFLLDTGHIAQVEGNQADWLVEEMNKRSNSLWKIPIYHVAAYPSIYEFNDPKASLIRKHWVTAFDEHGVRIVFEHHNHAYKRTYPLKHGVIDRSGVVYVGDGCFSANPRRRSRDRWYLERKQASCHICIVKISDKSIQVEVVSPEKKMIDAFEIGGF